MTSAVHPGVVGGGRRRHGEVGLDHSYFEWSALPARPTLSWPGQTSAALAVILDLGAVEWERHTTPAVPPPGGRGVHPHPDIPRMSHREYGHRAGIFRLLDVLGALRIPVGAAVDVLTAEEYPAVMDRLLGDGVEIIAHGLSASRPLTSLMSENEELDYIGTSVERLTSRAGSRPRGWLSPDLSQSARTPRLLAAAGLEYTCDWVNDEQPYPLAGDAEGAWVLPVAWDLSDLNLAFLRAVDPERQATAIREAAAVLVADGAAAGRSLTLHLTPWLAGQPFRWRSLSGVLADLAVDPGWWRATPIEIVTWCRNEGGIQ